MDNILLKELFAATKEEADCRSHLIMCWQSAQQQGLDDLTQKWGNAMLNTKKVKDQLGL